MAEIALERVSKRFRDGTVAVRDATFTIRDGEFFILVGPSGCGKSTLLNLIVGLDTASEGEIRVDGKVVNDLDPKDRNMAMVFQSYALYPHMTVRENLAFPLKLARRPAEEIRSRVDRAAEILRLGELLDRKPAALSGGQRQRVAMGRAIVREPAAFLMDEPLSNLDARLRIEMRTEIAALQRRLGTTTVYVTHDQTEAMTLGDRIAVLNRGAIQQIGTPKELYSEPANLFVAGFIGSPAMNLVAGELRDGRIRLPVLGLEVSPEAREPRRNEPCPVIAGIRPEHLLEARGAPSGSPSFSATVDVLEWLGSDVFAHVEIEGSESDRLRLVARLDPATQASEGNTIELAIDARTLHLFHRETGERLRVRS